MNYRKPNQAKLRLEQLEDRLVPSASPFGGTPPEGKPSFEPAACTQAHDEHACTGLTKAAEHSGVVTCSC